MGHLTRVVAALALAAVLLGAFPALAHGQDGPPTTLVAGWGVLREAGPGEFGTTTYDGWLVSGEHRLRGRWSAAGEIDALARTSPFLETQRLRGVFGGVRIGLMERGRMSLFARAMAGMRRFSEPGFESSAPSLQAGGGIDVSLGRALIVRGQIDYRRTRDAGAAFRDLRVVVGAGVRIGPR